MRAIKRSAMLVMMVLLWIVFSPVVMAAQRYGATLCQTDGYTCLTVPKGASWETLFPNQEERNLVMRINRMNVAVRHGMTIAVPQDINQSYLSYAPFPAQITPPGNRTLIVNPATLAWGAFDVDGRLVNWGPMSGGKGWCADIGSSCRTAVGKFTVYREAGENCISTKFPLPDGGAPMPYCMFFKGGYALHASTDVPGYHASHGCVRIFYDDAAWLNQNFVEKGTTVIVLPYSGTANLQAI